MRYFINYPHVDSESQNGVAALLRMNKYFTQTKEHGPSRDVGIRFFPSYWLLLHLHGYY